MRFTSFYFRPGLIIAICFIALFVSPATAAQPTTPPPAAAPLPGAEAEPITPTIPTVPDIIQMIDKVAAPQNPQEKAPEWTTPVKLVVIFTVLAIIPSLLAMTTSFTRIVIVLSFVRQALGTQSIPPTTVVMGLALFLTLYTMTPTFTAMNDQAIQPYLRNEIVFADSMDKSSQIMKEFMMRQTRTDDLRLFVQMAKITPPSEPTKLPLHVVVPAFIISEFRTAFEIGCLMFIPFLLLDLVIASVLLSAGMMMLPPVMISLPFKLILFILMDGWGILANSLSLSFK